MLADGMISSGEVASLVFCDVYLSRQTTSGSLSATLGWHRPTTESRRGREPCGGASGEVMLDCEFKRGLCLDENPTSNYLNNGSLCASTFDINLVLEPCKTIISNLSRMSRQRFDTSKIKLQG